jgi:hypothetical protein
MVTKHPKQGRRHSGRDLAGSIQELSWAVKEALVLTEATRRGCDAFTGRVHENRCSLLPGVRHLVALPGRALRHAPGGALPVVELLPGLARGH